MRQTLVFSLDQGYANGVTAAADVLGIQRMSAALERLRTRYDVCVLLTLTHPDWSRSLATLDVLAKLGLPFALNVVSSDVLTMAGYSWHSAYDAGHGVAQPIQRMIHLSDQYGANFAGMRSHETFAFSWMVDSRDPRTGAFADFLPQTPYFQVKVVEPFISLAHQRGMYVLWSDPYWSASHPEDHEQPKREQVLRDLVGAYPHTIVPMYANNFGDRPHGDYWPCLAPVLSGQVRGWGLSDQAWMWGDPTKAPPYEVVRWAADALRGGCPFVEFEPSWYFFNLPFGGWDAAAADYPSDPAWADRGQPTEAFHVLEKALLAL